ncbi:hypothetical protein GSI_04539 [Ganoderma sinense ZZ0214-1]|uniref:F-box domain-containing protein n=1 Tax=Ganoderma sinense ZZ0214-1 TaxID=1077348 RepID=A0A2G8SH36_9APHY|nr:hypothetical protein GSI_04539 [Ganoderma sinense ZZ0214-1]
MILNKPSPDSAPTAPSMQPPTEVLEAIIDQASDNTETLHQLSLTCTTLLPRSRIRLFAGIVIRTVEQLESSRKFLDSHPWLAPLVRKVTLEITAREDAFTERLRNVRLLDAVPIHLLNRLPNLDAWTMTSQSRWIIHTGSSLSLHRSVLWRYRKYGNHIRSLELSGIVFDRMPDFTGLVSAFTGIETLTCYDIYVNSKPRRVEAGSSESPVLVDMNVQPLPISTLKTFKETWT